MAKHKNPSARVREAAPRRSISLSLLLVGTAVAVLLAPLAVLAAAAADLITGWRRKRFLRLVAMAASFLWYELGGLLWALLLWFATGFGLLARRPWSVEAHRRLQAWWASGLLQAMERTVGCEIFTIDLDLASRPGPILVAGRHVSIGDALLPSALISGTNGFIPRHVVKEGLAWDPCLDFVGHRMANYFVDREATSSGDELRQIELLAHDASANTALVIFPEGTFRSDTRHARAVAKLNGRDPELGAIAATLDHLLPPRPGGTLALLDGCPDADVVLYAHTGFEQFSSFAAIVRNVPFRRPVHVRFWRFPRAAVPTGEARTRWLFDRWQELDQWITDVTAEPARLEGARPWPG